MLKKMTLAALACVSMSAMAQTMTTDSRNSWQPGSYSTSMMQRRMNMIETGAINHESRRDVVEHLAQESLSAGDRYMLRRMLDRVPANQERAIVDAIFQTHRQAAMLTNEMVMSRYPSRTTVITTTQQPSTGTTTTTVTTVTGSQPVLMTESQMRPMRMVMEGDNWPKSLTYDTAFDLLAAGLDTTTSSTLGDWWTWTASERERDILVRLAQDFANMGMAYMPMRDKWGSIR